MVQSTNQNTRTGKPVETLRETIRAALDDGVTLVEFEELVSNIVAEHKREVVQLGVPIYDILPPGLITIDQAADKYDVNRNTIYMWVKRGRVTEVARLRHSGTGGGKIAISREELEAFMAAPKNKGGRPRQNM